MKHPITVNSRGITSKVRYGSFSIRTEITVLPADKPYKNSFNDHIIITSKGITKRKFPGLKLGWTVKETIGVAVVNARGVSKGKKSVIIG